MITTLLWQAEIENRPTPEYLPSTTSGIWTAQRKSVQDRKNPETEHYPEVPIRAKNTITWLSRLPKGEIYSHKYYLNQKQSNNVFFVLAHNFY